MTFRRVKHRIPDITFLSFNSIPKFPKILSGSIEMFFISAYYGYGSSQFQAISFEAADLKTEIEMASLLNYKAAYLADVDNPLHAAATMILA